MLASILLAIGVAFVLINVWIGWKPNPPTRHRYWGQSGNAINGRLLLDSWARHFFSGNGSAWIVQHLTRTPVLECYSYTQIPPTSPKCKIWRIEVVPKEPMKSVRLIVHFDQPINESVLARIGIAGEQHAQKLKHPVKLLPSRQAAIQLSLLSSHLIDTS